MHSLCEKPYCLVITMCLKKQAAAAVFEMGGERAYEMGGHKTSLRNFLCSILFVDKVLLSLDPNNGFVFALVCFPAEKTIYCFFCDAGPQHGTLACCWCSHQAVYIAKPVNQPISLKRS